MQCSVTCLSRGRAWPALLGLHLALLAAAPAIASDAEGVVCSFSGKGEGTRPRMPLGSNPAEQLLTRWSGEMHQLLGLNSNLKIGMDQIPAQKAIAHNRDGVRLVIFDRHTFADIEQNRETSWAAKAILAHELGHQMQGHVVLKERSPAHEIEADRFSGGLLFRLGAKVAEAQSAVREYGAEEASPTHPPRDQRLSAVREGWKAARTQEGLAARRREYSVVMAAAAEAVRTNQVLHARALLESQLPSPGEPDVRSFPWFHLWRQLFAERERIEVADFVVDPSADRRPLEIVDLALLPRGSGLAVLAGPGGISRRLTLYREAAGHYAKDRVLADGNVSRFAIDGAGERVVVSTPDHEWSEEGFSLSVVRLDGGVGYSLAKGPQRTVSLAMSRDGNRVAAAFDDGSWSLWNGRGLVCRRDGAPRKGTSADRRTGPFVTSVLFVPRASGAPEEVVTGDDRGQVTAWSGGCVQRRSWQPGAGPVKSMAVLVAPDDTGVVVAGEKGWTLFGVSSDEIGEVRTLDQGVTVTSVTVGGRYLALGTNSGEAIVVDAYTQKAITHIRGHVGSVSAVALTDDGSSLFTGDLGQPFPEGPGVADGVIRRFDIDGSTASLSIPLAHSGVRTSASANGQVFAATRWDDQTIVWGDPRHPDGTVIPGSGYYSALHVFADGSAVAVGDSAPTGDSGASGTVSLFDMASQRVASTWQAANGFVLEMAGDVAGSCLAVASTDGVSVWEVRDRSAPRLRASRPREGPSPRAHLAVSDDCSWIAEGGNEEPEVVVRDGNTLEPLRSLSPRALTRTSSLAVCSGGRLVAQGSTDWNVTLWSLSRERAPVLLAGHASLISALAFSPDCRYLASAARGWEDVRIWDVETGLPVGRLEGPGTLLTRMWFDGARLLALAGETLVSWTVSLPADVTAAARREWESRRTVSARQVYVRAIWAQYLSTPSADPSLLEPALTILQEAQAANRGLSEEEQEWMEELRAARAAPRQAARAAEPVR